MSQILTRVKARELLEELECAKAHMGGQLSIRDEYFRQALEDKLRLDEALKAPVAYANSKDLIDDGYGIGTFTVWENPPGNGFTNEGDAVPLYTYPEPL